jgi:hypothetical protein
VWLNREKKENTTGIQVEYEITSLLELIEIVNRD